MDVEEQSILTMKGTWVIQSDLDRAEKGVTVYPGNPVGWFWGEKQKKRSFC